MVDNREILLLFLEGCWSGNMLGEPISNTELEQSEEKCRNQRNTSKIFLDIVGSEMRSELRMKYREKNRLGGTEQSMAQAGWMCVMGEIEVITGIREERR